MTKRYILIDSADTLQEAIQHLANHTTFAFDTETTGLNVRKERVIGFSFTGEVGKGYYYPIWVYNKQANTLDNHPFHDEDNLNTILGLLKRSRLVMHNASFDIRIVSNNLKVNLLSSLHADTMLMEHTINEDGPFGLKDICIRRAGELGLDDQDAANQEQLDLQKSVVANGGKWIASNKEMYKADLDILSKYACFAEKSAYVSMSDGSSKLIEDIQIGEEVITHEGTTSKVYDLLCQDYQGSIYDLELEVGRMQKNVTPDHKYLVLNQSSLKEEWIRVLDLKEGDLLIRPEVKGKLHYTLSSKFWWIFGMYQAEGHISIRGNLKYPVFSVHQKEAEQVRKTLQELGYSSSIHYKKNSLGCDITVCDSKLGSLFLELSGGNFKCHEKKINRKVLEHLIACPKHGLSFIAGILDRDGHYRETKRGSQLTLEITSPSLINSLDLLLSSFGINSTRNSLPPLRGRKARHCLRIFGKDIGVFHSICIFKKIKESSVTTFKKYVRITSIKKKEYTGKVYNIEVENQHSYISNGIITHNCADVDMTLRLYNYNRRRLETEGLWDLFSDIEVMPAYKYNTIKMEHRGVHIDMDRLDELSHKITDKIKEYEKVVVDSLTSTPEFNDFITTYLNTEYPVSNKGGFAQEVCLFAKLDLPVTATGKYSITNKNVSSLPDSIYKSFLLSGESDYIPEGTLIEIQRNLHRRAENSPYLINIGSKIQLKTLVFDYLKVKPLTTTDKGSPQFNDAFVESIAKTYDWAEKIRVYNKLNKIKSSYFDRFQEYTEDGIYYPTFKQHGTTSSRYSSDFQQLPRPKDEDSEEHPLVKEFSDCIRELVVPAPGYDFIDTDYESLEPRCVDENSLVCIYTKGIVRIKEVAIGDRIYTSSGFKTVLKKFSSNKDSLKIITKKGVITCSEDHKIYVNQKWVLAKDIKTGDCLEEHKFDYEGNGSPELDLFVNKSDKSGVSFGTKHLSEDEAWMLGAFLGDGVFSNRGRSNYIGICGVLEDGVLEKFTSIFSQYGFLETRMKDNRTSSNMQTHIYSSVALVDIFNRTYRVTSSGRKIMRVPSYLFNHDESYKLAFLAGLIDTDGTFSGKDLSISSKYPEFLSEVNTLANTLGLDGRIGIAHSKKYSKKCYQLRFTSVSINKLISMDFKKFQVVSRKKISRVQLVGKVESPSPEVLEIIKGEVMPMIDITVSDNHEFICDNLRVHNCFADDAGDAALIKIFTDNLDMYSVVAIGAENITDANADKKSPDFLKKKYPLRRQNAKAYALGIRYGMKSFKLSKTLDISVEEADKIIHNYFSSFPGLKKAMDKYLREVKTTGKVTSKFGRVRHLPRAKEIYSKFGDGILDYNNLRKISQKTYVPVAELKLIRKEYNNLLNNALNFPIQSAATSILTRSCIAMAKQFISEGIDAWLSLSIHDQAVVSCNKKDTARAKQIIQECMENTTKLAMPLIAVPAVGTNLRDAH